jgi:hypothetical protein
MPITRLRQSCDCVDIGDWELGLRSAYWLHSSQQPRPLSLWSPRRTRDRHHRGRPSRNNSGSVDGSRTIGGRCHRRNWTLPIRISAARTVSRVLRLPNFTSTVKSDVVVANGSEVLDVVMPMAMTANVVVAGGATFTNLADVEDPASSRNPSARRPATVRSRSVH